MTAGAATERVLVPYERRDYALLPSPGHILLPKHGTKLHHDPACGHLTDSGSMPRGNDPDGLTWRRLLDAGPAADTTARVRYAERIGLLNQQGRPITHLCSCTFAPVNEAQAKEIRPWSLDEALAAFDPGAFADRLIAAERQAEAIREAFPWDNWPYLKLERYAMGQGDKPYCYRVEFEAEALGSGRGAFTKGHLVTYRKQSESWYHDERYADENEAWAAVRAGIGEAVVAAREGRVADIDDIEAVRSGNGNLISKTLRLYAPEATLPIHDLGTVKHYIARLTGRPAPAKLGVFATRALLASVVDESGRFDGWSRDQVALFLHWWAAPTRPPRIVKIAPGRDASLWEDCLAGGYAAVGWDEVGDLRDFADKDEFKRAFGTANAERYAGSRSKISAKANEVWTLMELHPGDMVVANRGTSEIVGIGTVTDEGYVWRPERPHHRHTVSVEWRHTPPLRLEERVPAWALVTVKDVPAKLWSQIESRQFQDVLDGLVKDEKITAQPLDPALQRMADALDRRGQAVLFGPPGTGKTYAALRFAVRWLGERSDGTGELDPYAEPGSPGFGTALDLLTAPVRDFGAGRLTLVTFHPSYGYEDFVEGFRPVKGGAGLTLDRVDGVFKRVCAAAAADPDHPYLVIVDELNRGNLPKIFGELVTLLEKDKRGRSFTLPLSGERFAIPRNVHLIGTMNTADRSIRMLDAAIRRRFAFLELLPDSAPLQGFYVDRLHLAAFLDALNQRIREQLDREKQIGHAFFLPNGEPVSSVAELAEIIRTEILPLLQEYAYDDYTLLTSFLGEGLVDAETHTLREIDDESLVAALYSEFRTDGDTGTE
ncbi:McrB family protein [Streptomyces sp. NPDC050658]|uniref:McrB family protein n=1 Tax=unclassified Streptomyces TaxID=2593676 RepID=UPI00344A3539